MRKLLLIFAAIGLMAGFAGKVMATDPISGNKSVTDPITLGMPEIMDLGIIHGTFGGIALNFVAPTAQSTPGTAGAAVAEAVSDPAKLGQLLYTSVIVTDSPHIISAKYTGTMPAGTTLAVTAGDATAVDGTAGTSKGKKDLATTDVTIIDAIGSCYTGTTSGSSGHTLTYAWRVSSYADVIKSTTQTVPITVTYTISD